MDVGAAHRTLPLSTAGTGRCPLRREGARTGSARCSTLLARLPQRRLPGRVDDWRGGGRRKGVAVPGGFRHVPVPHSPPWLRFQSPLIKPDVRISRIRLSDEIMPSPTEGAPFAQQGA